LNCSLPKLVPDRLRDTIARSCLFSVRVPRPARIPIGECCVANLQRVFLLHGERDWQSAQGQRGTSRCLDAAPSVILGCTGDTLGLQKRTAVLETGVTDFETWTWSQAIYYSFSPPFPGRVICVKICGTWLAQMFFAESSTKDSDFRATMMSP
jgi:hypothetical protein